MKNLDLEFTIINDFESVVKELKNSNDKTKNYFYKKAKFIWKFAKKYYTEDFQNKIEAFFIRNQIGL